MGYNFFYRYNKTIANMVLSGRYTSEVPGELLKNMPVLAPPINGDSASWSVVQNDMAFGMPLKERPGRPRPGEWVFRKRQGVRQMIRLRI